MDKLINSYHDKESSSSSSPIASVDNYQNNRRQPSPSFYRDSLISNASFHFTYGNSTDPSLTTPAVTTSKLSPLANDNELVPKASLTSIYNEYGRLETRESNVSLNSESPSLVPSVYFKNESSPKEETFLLSDKPNWRPSTDLTNTTTTPSEINTTQINSFSRLSQSERLPPPPVPPRLWLDEKKPTTETPSRHHRRGRCCSCCGKCCNLKGCILIIIIFMILLLSGVFFAWPRDPTISLQDVSYQPVAGAIKRFDLSIPQNYTIYTSKSYQASLMIDNGNFLPWPLESLTLSVYDLLSNEKIGGGSLNHFSLPIKKSGIILNIPFDINYSTKNLSEPTLRHFITACSGDKPKMPLRLILSFGMGVFKSSVVELPGLLTCPSGLELTRDPQTGLVVGG